MWQPDETYRHGLAFFDGVVKGAGDGWERPSPCQGWTALDVLGHVGAAAEFGTALLTGQQPAWTPSESPREAVHGEPVAWWDQVSTSISDALVGADLAREIDSPRGKRSIGEGLTFPAIDLFVHGWDLAVATGQHVELPGPAIEFARRVFERVPAAQLRDPKVFGPECALDEANGEAVDESDAFLAWTGRDPRWTSPVP